MPSPSLSPRSFFSSSFFFFACLMVGLWQCILNNIIVLSLPLPRYNCVSLSPSPFLLCIWRCYSMEKHPHTLSLSFSLSVSLSVSVSLSLSLSLSLSPPLFSHWLMTLRSEVGCVSRHPMFHPHSSAQLGTTEMSLTQEPGVLTA